MSLDSWESHLMAALTLLRDVRYQAVIQQIDPRAMRVAMKYGMIADTYLSKQHGLTEEEDQELTEIARKLFRETPKHML